MEVIMYQITKAKKLADKIYLMDVVAPRVAANCLPGQFIIAKVDKEGEQYSAYNLRL